MNSPLAIPIPPELVDQIADQVAERLEQDAPSQAGLSPYLTTDQAAAYLCCSRQRIHDLLTQGKLSRHKEGRRTLVLRAELEQLVQLDRKRRTR